MTPVLIGLALALAAHAEKPALAPPQAASPASVAEPATDPRLLNLDEVITADDYPAEAIARNEEGVATVKLVIKEDGRIGDCVVIEPSGSAALDSRTCQLLWLRARFEPARDKKGAPVVAEVEQRIRWILASLADPVPFQPRLLNLDELVTADDYPADAIERNEEGVATVRLLINKDGRIGDCVIVESSGSAALDSQTCRLFWLRGRFEPARDNAGTPVVAEFEQRIHWVLESSAPPTPFEPWTIRTLLLYDDSGAPISCEMQSVGPMNADFCEPLKQFGAAFTAERAGAGLPVASLVLEVDFMPDGAGEDHLSSLRDGDVLLMRQVSRIRIDPSGNILECEAVSLEGVIEPPEDHCTGIRQERFVPLPQGAAGAAERAGTVSRSMYLERRRVAMNAAPAGGKRA